MKLILFDIDGTLVRVRHDVLFGILSDVVRHGTGYEDGVHNLELHGKTDRQIMLEICTAAGLDPEESLRRCPDMEAMLLEGWRRTLDAETVELLPGVHDVLNRLEATESVCLGLLTGNLEPAATLKLAPHGLDRYFSFGAFGSDAIERNKLPPIALERARSLTGHDITYEDTLIIGDSHRDIECARAWGIRALAVATGSLDMETLRGHAPDAVCATLNDSRYIFEFLGNVAA